ncbi:MAG: endonuclease MutS2 [Clostridiaceae bacterium]|nr:endonuclease MutS2 [Clostridiaceae bacterium]
MMDIRSQNILEYDKIIHELADLAYSEPGRQLCLALEPVADMPVVAGRQAETDDSVKLILEKGVLPLNGISEIRPAVNHARSGAQLSCGELLRIGAFLRAVDRLRSRLPEDEASDRLIYRIIAGLRPAPELSARLDDTIAGEDELYDRASPQLASIRRRIRDAQNEVKDSLARIVRSHARALQEQLVTMRGDRYVVPVKAEHRGEIPGLVHDTSSSGATLFIEPLPIVDLNNRIRELMGLEREEIDRILQELSGRVAVQAELLLKDAEDVACLDFISAKGRLALAMQAMPPRLNEEGRIRLLAARHPLIPRERVVPIDFELGHSFRTLVITGPNTGGKTVTLKTCGLFCLMAMAGLQIPAREGSEISIFDQVLADIGDEQSIEQDLSTFSSHLRHIVQITEQAKPRTLVLADELGSGTDPSEGAALAIAILDFLRQKGCLTVATTHYKELKGYALRTDGVENACCEFDTETLRPTYRLLIGVPGVSNAFAISSRLGLNGEIISQARSLISEEGIRFEELIQNVEKSRSEADRVRSETLALQAEVKERAQKLEDEKNRFEERNRQIVQQARQEARELYAGALQEVEQLLDDIRGQMKERELTESHRRAAKVRQEIRAGLNIVEGEIGKSTLSAQGEALRADQIHIGGTYAAPALNLIGRVIEGPDARGNYQIQRGALKVSVPGDALRHPAPERDTRQKGSRRVVRKESASGGSRTANSLTMDRRLHMQTEIQLLGQTVEEATANLDKFIDDAVLGGIQTIRIVHGKGTGALRSAVQQLLKRDKRVKTYRLGAYGEGDSGVTIADLQ